MTVPVSDFLKYVRAEVPGCPEPLLLDAVLRSAIDFCTRSELLSEILPLTTSDTNATYPIVPTDGTLYPAKLRFVLKDGLPLEKTNAASYVQLSERSEAGTPTHYFAPIRNQVTLAPVPNGEETLELDLVLRPDRDAVTLPDVLFDEWVDSIAAGAKYRLMLMLGLPWANPDLGAYYKNEFNNDIASAAVQVAQGNVDAAMHIEPSLI